MSNNNYCFTCRPITDYVIVLLQRQYGQLYENRSAKFSLGAKGAWN